MNKLNSSQKNVCAIFFVFLGIDPHIKGYEKIITKENKTNWVKSKVFVSHTHDVNSIVYLNNGSICSGGR